MEPVVTRRLAAILAADVVSYSRMMGADEEGTLARLHVMRREVTDPAIARHEGRIFKTMGDGLLVEFPSVVAAVRCAVDVQAECATRNAGLAQAQQMWLRVGVNLGDIIGEGADVFGDGVNIAARLEGICEPGGVAIGRNVYEQVRAKLPQAWQDAGSLHLKNIAEPVRVYRWRPGTAGATHRIPRLSRRGIAALATVAALTILGVAGWAGYRFRPFLNAPKPPALSIVVLPLDNLSRDPAQDYFVDALTEDLITDLSRISGALVIARNTSFTFKGKAVDVKQVARDLNVRYVLEGSVQRQSQEVRVTVQLIDGESGAHLWAERFDRRLDNLFALQNEITGRIARSLNLEMNAAESRRVQQGSAGSMDVQDYTWRAAALLMKIPRTQADSQEALVWVRKALTADPDNSTAWRQLADIHAMDAFFRFSPSRTESLRLAIEAGTRAVALNQRDASAYGELAFAYGISGQQEQSISAAEQCIELNRNVPWCYTSKAYALVLSGRMEESLPWSAKAFDLSPRDPGRAGWYSVDSLALLLLGRNAEAVAAAKRSIAADPMYAPSYSMLAAAYGNLGNLEPAREAWSKFMTFPFARDYSTSGKLLEIGRRLSTNPVFLGQRERYYLGGLRKAGLLQE